MSSPSLLSQLFDRIGIGNDDKILLMQDEGITDILDLVTIGKHAGSAMTNLRLSLAIDYLTENMSRHGRAAGQLLRDLLAIEEWADDLWEQFVFRRFDLPAEDFLVHPAAMMDGATASLREHSTSELEPGKSSRLGDTQIKEIKAKTQNTSWKCNDKDQAVELFASKDQSTTNKSLSVPYKVFGPLFTHQMEGIERLYANFDRGLGGLLLGDEMGLGKTRQALILNYSLMLESRIKRVCVLCPPGLIKTWYDEATTIFRGFTKLHGGFDIIKYSSGLEAKKRDGLLRGTRRKGCPLLVIASNCLVGGKERYNNPLFPTGKESGLTWDFVVVDEAHQRVKNPKTKLGDALRSKQSKLTLGSFVLLLTATPIENNIQEFCNLLTLVSGDKRFEDFFKANQKAIKAGQQKSTSPRARRNTTKLINELQNMADPYVLQRSMKEHFKDKLPKKDEYVVWVRPSNAQWEATQKLLQSDTTEHAICSENRFCVFAIIQRYRMICCHPFFAKRVTEADVKSYLASSKARGPNVDLDELMESSDATDTGKVKGYLSENRSAEVMKASPMLRVCKDLLEHFTATGHKTLVFCSYRMPLDFLEHVLDHSKLGFYRIDGPTSANKRDKYIRDFNKKGSTHKIMLITVGAGGLGLTLTGADRVIQLGPSWNPMVDAQAIGRAYRIGQKRPVAVYRILMASLIDEKIYGKQLQKEAVIREVQTETGGCLPRYFDDKELSELLTIGKRGVCEILERLPNNKIDPANIHIFGGHAKVYGITRHEAVYRNFSNRFAGKRSADAMEDIGGPGSTLAEAPHTPSERGNMIRMVSQASVVSVCKAKLAKIDT